MPNSTIMNTESADDHVDDHVDQEIQACFSAENPRCFFVSAGAGSGKTRSLIRTLNFLEQEQGESLITNGKQIAVITYTNAACDEISRRLHYKRIFSVSTIHSFLWELVKPYQADIKEWMRQSITEELNDLKNKQTQKSTKFSKADYIKRTKERLENIETIQKFSYNPNGDNIRYDSLRHNEVIKMSTDFINNEPTMQDILVAKYPILLIDECQDTNQELINALFDVCNNHARKFIVGMFGDTMQRIYMDGCANLADHIPADWVKLTKVMNHRSATRIVDLANAIRSTVDEQKQKARSDASVGTVRLFIAPSPTEQDPAEEKNAQIEEIVTEIMASDTGDEGWKDNSTYKSLILEHHMAASRFGFSDLYLPLNKSRQFDTALRNGSITELSMLANMVLPLVKAYQEHNNFEVAKIVRKFSPLLDNKTFEAKSDDQAELLQNAENAVEDLMKLWSDNTTPSCLDVLRSIHDTGLFEVTSRTEDILADEYEGGNAKVSALRKALLAPFSELEQYSLYVTDRTTYATHQGVKGLEFPRVMVIMNDEQAHGFMFSYEKLFGAKPKSDTDSRNEQIGKDTSITRTSRLFYVACTRAQNSLAVVAYTKDANSVKRTALSNIWFSEEEIIILSDNTRHSICIN